MSEHTANDKKPVAEVSAKWQEKFALLETIGADRQFIFKAMAGAAFKGLSFSQRHKITFNLWAFFFGPLYYFAKKMWHKGALLLALTWLWGSLVFLAEIALDSELPGVAYWILPAVLCGQLANYDYFRFISQNEKVWPALPPLLRATQGVIAAPLIAFSLLFTLTLSLMPVTPPQCYSSEVTDVVLELSKEEILKRLAISSPSAVDLTLTAINTTTIAATDTNEHNLAYQCAAQLQVSGQDISNSIPVSYSIELTDNGNAFNVSVFL